MRKFTLLCASLCATMLLFSASAVRAQSVLWIAANGSDLNVCSQTSPCQSFQGALNKGGVSQINCLTSGNYGAVTITASLTIDCGAGNIGTVSITGSTNSAVTLNTSSAAAVILRHLSLNGNNSAKNGIDGGTFSSGTLVVEDCTIQGFTVDGILIESTDNRSDLQVSDSTIFNNGNGIVVNSTNNNTASATLNRVEVTGNSFNGVVLAGIVVAGTMRDSLVAGNALVGVIAGATQVFFTVEESSVVANLSVGIRIDTAGSVVNVGSSTIGGNGTGVKVNNLGSLISFGNNQMSANGSNGNFTGTAMLQ